MYDWNFPFKVICFCTSGLLAVLLLILDGTVKLPGHHTTVHFCLKLS